jgi:hypothetical protein
LNREFTEFVAKLDVMLWNMMKAGGLKRDFMYGFKLLFGKGLIMERLFKMGCEDHYITEQVDETLLISQPN